MKICLIVNPNAGKKKGTEAANTAAELFLENGIEVNILTSNYPGHSVYLAENLDLTDLDGIIAVGGDGTLFEVLNGVMKNNRNLSIPLGQIPVGTGNSFSKDLGISSVKDAVDAVIRGNTQRVDIGEFSYSKGSYFFINLLGAGFVSNVAYKAEKYKKLGSLSYIIGVFREVIGLKSSKIEIEIDGEKSSRSCIFVEICNSRFTGGNMLMSPSSRINDGLLDIIILQEVSRMKLLSLFPALFKGEHVNDSSIEVLKGKKIILTSETELPLTPDGETFGETPITVKIHPGKIEMFR